MSEPITNREDAVRELGALPMPAGGAFVPRTERSYWEDIAAALNAATAAGMPVGIDLDGTLTDRNAWSVVWEPGTGTWTVAGYEDEDPERPVSVGETYWRRTEPSIRVTVTRVWQYPTADEPSVAFDTHGKDWRGEACTTHSALRVSLFRKLYRLDTTVSQPEAPALDGPMVEVSEGDAATTVTFTPRGGAS